MVADAVLEIHDVSQPTLAGVAGKELPRYMPLPASHFPFSESNYSNMLTSIQVKIQLRILQCLA